MNKYWGPETGDAARAFDVDDDVIDGVLDARQIASGNDTGGSIGQPLRFER